VIPGQLNAHIRDVPSSCVCSWEYDPAKHAWRLIASREGCPWHAEAGKLLAVLRERAKAPADAS
jgi:hypothetical protein